MVISIPDSTMPFDYMAKPSHPMGEAAEGIIHTSVSSKKHPFEAGCLPAAVLTEIFPSPQNLPA